MISFHSVAPGGWGIHSTDTRMQFPAGEEHIIDGAPDSEVAKFVYVSGTDANEYISAAMWCDMQFNKGHKVAALIPYLPGARQDRGIPSGALVYAELINIISADQVIAFDPHSLEITTGIHNLTVIDLEPVVLDALRPLRLPPYTGVIAPDKGAVDRAGRVAMALQVPLHLATKVRDFKSGRLTGFECEPLPEGGKFLVVDDICDGGGTFLGLAGATGLPREQLGLWVSHGVFSGSPSQSRDLVAAYGEILTTDSHPGWRNTTIQARVQRILPYLQKAITL